MTNECAVPVCAMWMQSVSLAPLLTEDFCSLGAHLLVLGTQFPHPTPALLAAPPNFVLESKNGRTPPPLLSQSEAILRLPYTECVSSEPCCGHRYLTHMPIGTLLVANASSYCQPTINTVIRCLYSYLICTHTHTHTHSAVVHLVRRMLRHCRSPPQAPISTVRTTTL